MATERPSVTGAAGTPPPPDAPVQVATGADTPGNVQYAPPPAETIAALGDRVDPAMVGASAADMARANERELAPLAPVPPGAPPIVKGPVVAASAVQPAGAPPSQQMDALARAHTGQPLQRRTRQPFTPAVPVVDAASKAAAAPAAAAVREPFPKAPVVAAGPAPDQTLGTQRPGVDIAIPADGPHQPAASNTDSPSRGIPRAIGDPLKQITGGFATQADAQYFPLSGDEALKVVWKLMDELAQRLQNDLRFSMAVTYPRISIKAMIVVEAYTEDHAIEISRIAPPHEKTPIEIAIQHGDEVCFVVKTQRREFNEAGEPESPPNALRAETGSTIPRKQAFGTGAQRIIADVSS